MVFGVPYLRRTLVSKAMLQLFRKIMPPISATEQEMIDAGTVWWDGELFSGHPDWNKLLAYPKCALSVREQLFLDTQVEQLCGMLDDWNITCHLADLPAEVWTYLKHEGFFGMIIPKVYGGLEFSAQAHSAILGKIASRSGTAAMTVMAANSLGPAELLLHYGTEVQKKKYLRRLARGQEIPCFALTGPEAGSDTTAIGAYGIVCKGEFAGKTDVTLIRLNWEKRYITLAPVATLIALVFKLYDPEQLLSSEMDRGISLALIPAELNGVQTGRRHLPLSSAVLNGPSTGCDVLIPLDYLIGGEARIGQGWRMLMESLAAGGAISLPAGSTGEMKLAARTSGAYCRVRRQFNLPIGLFEGVEEALARIGAHTYMVDAARAFTALALDMGEKPSVISAIVKYHATERGRTVINDAMDIQGGKGINMGPDNYLGRIYQQLPVAITTEGANILTRSRMIFGQGALRSHPYVLKEIAASREANEALALHLFDDAFFGHIGFVLCNAARSLVFGLTGGYGIPVSKGVICRHYYQQMTRFSSAFAFSADIAIMVLGGSLNRHEKLSARLGDVLSQLYLCSATMKRYADDGRPASDLPLVDWAMQDGLYKIQLAFEGIIQNFPNFLVRCSLRALIFPLGRRLTPPSDLAGHKVAALLMQPGHARDRLTAGIYISDDEQDAVGALEAALASTLECESLQTKLRTEHSKYNGVTELQRIAQARDGGVITAEQALSLGRDYALRRKIIMVNDFAPDIL